MTPTGTGGSLEAQEVVNKEYSRRHVVAIPTEWVLMSDPAQADGNIKVTFWCYLVWGAADGANGRKGGSELPPGRRWWWALGKRRRCWDGASDGRVREGAGSGERDLAHRRGASEKVKRSKP